ncbi:MAG: GNAT family N-acetyltransferase [Pseudomonadota bacterium]
MVAGSVTMRRATDADLPAIVAMLADDQLGGAREDASTPLDPGYVAAFAAIDADPNQLLAVAELDSKIVGTLQLSYLPGLSFRGAWRGQIEAVRVATALRGHGIGAQMIDWAVGQCRDRGCRMVQLTSNLTRTDAHRFYERLGWDKSHAGFKLHLR